MIFDKPSSIIKISIPLHVYVYNHDMGLLMKRDNSFKQLFWRVIYQITWDLKYSRNVPNTFFQFKSNARIYNSFRHLTKEPLIFFFFFFCSSIKASLRTARNLKSCRNPESVNNDTLKSEIAGDVINGMGVVAEHPLGF